MPLWFLIDNLKLVFMSHLGCRMDGNERKGGKNANIDGEDLKIWTQSISRQFMNAFQFAPAIEKCSVRLMFLLPNCEFFTIWKERLDI